MAADLTVPRLKALAHPIRLGMLRRLAEEPEVCACDLGEAFGVSQPTVSQHLRVLREAGLVRTRRQGTQICYSADPRALVEVEAALAALRPRPSVAAARPEAGEVVSVACPTVAADAGLADAGTQRVESERRPSTAAAADPHLGASENLPVPEFVFEDELEVLEA